MERQRRNIKAAYPSAVLIEEVYTGTKTAGREKWQRLAVMAKAGDTIVFDEVSRMSRDAAEGFAIYEELFGRGVELVFLKEPHINTSVYRAAIDGAVEMTGNEIVDVYLDATNRVLMILAKNQIRIAFEKAQAEVEFLHQRTREGLITAKLAGKQIGRVTGRKYEAKKAAPAKAVIRQHCRDFGGSLTDREVMQLAGISKNTYYKYKREVTREIALDGAKA
jgi:DNA invertase Pin-like site-specific DNA recombinase